jgi:hypothetical protein
MRMLLISENVRVCDIVYDGAAGIILENLLRQTFSQTLTTWGPIQ